MDQYLLARARITQHKDVQPRGAEHLGDSGGLGPAQAIGHWQQVALVNNHLLGHATAGQQRTHTVAQLPARAFCNLDYLTCALKTQHTGHTRRRRVHAGLLQQVSTVQASGLHTNTHFAGLQLYSTLGLPRQRPALGLQSSHATSIVLINGHQRELAVPRALLKAYSLRTRYPR